MEMLRRKTYETYARLSIDWMWIILYNIRMKTYSFEALIHKVPDLDGAYIIFPYDIKQEFGKGRVKVHATFDGLSYDGSIVNMGVVDEQGRICYIIGIRKDIRMKIGKQPGDTVLVTIREMIAPAL